MSRLLYAVVLLASVAFASVLSANVAAKVVNQTVTTNNNITEPLNHDGSFQHNNTKQPAAKLEEPALSASNGREGVVSSTISQRLSEETPNNKTNVKMSNTTSNNITEIPSKIFPRKGVSLVEEVKKPTITESDDDNNEYVKTDTKPNKNVFDGFVPDNKEHKRAAYLIPIIAVIFSVPLVAAVISVLYKRGSEWWQHRHYKRMDFLIEGMYNN